MFQRANYKNNAKIQLQGHWKVPLLVTLVSYLCTLPLVLPELYTSFAGLMNPNIIVSATRTSDTQGIVSFISIIINSIILFATSYFFILFSSNNQTGFSSFLEGLNYWLKAILIFLWTMLWTTLWSLLLFIPGVIKGIAYSQMTYIIAENPKIGVRKAMKMSIAMTKGYKGDLFVMYLSFIGWYILSTITCGLVNFYLIPYSNVTYINAYKFLKTNAIENGVLKETDFDTVEKIEQ